MNYLRKRFPRYADYAKARLSDVFTKEELSTAYVAKSETFQSVYLENRGNGKFVLRALPTLAQQAPINGLLARDFDGDGRLDLLTSGNFYGTEAITGRYDASIGLLLKGDGRGHFTPVPARESGFWVDGDARGLAEVVLPGGRRLILAAQNDGHLKAFVWPNRFSGGNDPRGRTR